MTPVATQSGRKFDSLPRAIRIDTFTILRKDTYTCTYIYIEFGVECKINLLTEWKFEKLAKQLKLCCFIRPALPLLYWPNYCTCNLLPTSHFLTFKINYKIINNVFLTSKIRHVKEIRMNWIQIIWPILNHVKKKLNEKFLIKILLWGRK